MGRIIRLAGLPKVHPDLGLACLRHRRDREYRLWVLARAVDATGSGRLAVAELGETLEVWRIRGASPGTVRRLLRAGEATFWTRYVSGGLWLALRGLAATCAAMGVGKLQTAPVFVPLELCRTVAGFRGTIVASISAGGKDG